MRDRPPLRRQVADLQAQIRDLAKLGKAMRDAQADAATEARFARHSERIGSKNNREPAASAARLRAEGLARDFDRRVAQVLEANQDKEVARA